MIVVLVLNTPEVVDIEEGFLTFSFFFILIILSYLTDIGVLSCGSSEEKESHEEKRAVNSEMTKEELAQMVQKVRRQSGTGNMMTEQEVMVAIEKETAAPKSRAVYRAQALRQMIGGKKIKDECPHEHENVKNVTKATGTGDLIEQELKEKEMIVEFAACRYAVLENCREVRLLVQRRGNISEA